MGSSQLERERTGRRIRSARDALGLKQVQLVRRLTAAADACEIAVAGHESMLAMLSGWETGHRRVAEKYVPLLAEVLGIDPVDLGGSTVENDGQGEELADAAGFDGSALILAAATESAQLARLHSASCLHPATLEQLAADVRSLAVDFVTGEPRGVTRRALTIRDEAFALLEGHQWPDQARQLYSVAGWACGLLSVASSDFFGQTDAAAAQCRTAWMCAEMSEDIVLKTWVCELQSGVALWAGQWSRAAEMGATARGFARTAPAMARAATAEARGLARLGDIEGVRRAIAISERAADELPVGEQDVGVFGFSEANRLRCAGTALLWLGEHQAAEQQLGEALSAYERDEPTAATHLAVTRADIAIVRLAGGDVDGAADALRPVLALPPERRLAGAIRRAATLRKQLARTELKDSPTASVLIDDIADFMKTGS
jgi:transcriptional regulator with XRE-family HTH domain